MLAPKGTQKVTKKPTKKPRRETHTVGFRVDDYTLTRLERGAAAYGISVHEYARQRLLELLDRQEEVRLLEEATTTRQSVERLREDVAMTLEIILINIRDADTEEKRVPIRDWVRRHLKRQDEEA